MEDAWRDRIAAHPKVLVGKPVIMGTRIAVEFLLELLAEGRSREKIRGNYPQLSDEDIEAALRFAAEAIARDRLYPLTG